MLKTELRKFPWQIWLLCFLTFACFYQREQNSNITTRIALALSIVERHELMIDQFAPYTIDIAKFGEHYYADKAPGLSLLAVPLLALAKPWLKLPSNPLTPPKLDNYKPAYIGLIYVLTLIILGGATATATALMFRWCRTRGSSVAASTFACIAYAFATPIMWWSTAFFGHAAASATLLIGFVTLSDALVPPLPSLGIGETGNRVDAGQALLGGLFLGLSFLIEFTAGPAVAIIAVCCGLDALVLTRSTKRIVLTFLVSGIGLAVPMLTVGLYNVLTFGSPLHLGYASVNDFPGMKSGFFGISAPDLHVARLLLIGQYRGLLMLAPILLLAPLGIIISLRHREWRFTAIAGALVFLWYWMMNAGYYYWWGGYSTGPRQLVPGLSLLLIPLAPLWDRLKPALRYPAFFLLACSIAIAVTLASLDIAAPEWTWQPFKVLWLPMLQRFEFPRLVTDAFGLGGLWGFIPLLIVWFTCGTPVLRAALRSTKPLAVKET